jgi:two-component system response regulator FixJ
MHLLMPQSTTRSVASSFSAGPERAQAIDESIIHIVDEKQPMLDALGLLLETEGFAVRAYASARTLLATVRQGDTGCIVAHAHLPDMSGLDLLAALKERRISMPVIVTTARGKGSLHAELVNQGASEVLETTFASDALLASIRSALRR